MRGLSYLNKYLYKYKHLLLLGCLFIILSNFFQIAPAIIIRYTLDIIIDKVNQYHHFSESNLSDILKHNAIIAVFICALIILFASLLRGSFLFLVRQTIITMSRYIEYDYKNEIYQHYQNLSLRFYNTNNTGDLMARISEDVSRVRMYLGPAIMYGLNLIFLFAMVIPYMFFINARLSLFALIPLPILSIVVYFISKVINKKSEVIQNKLSQLSSYVQENLSGVRVIKAFAKELQSSSHFEEESNEYKQNSLSLSKTEAFFFPVITSMIGLSVIAVIYIGGQEIFIGKATYGNIAEFVIYINMLTWPVTALGWVTSLIQRAKASQKRISNILFQKNELKSDNTIKPKIDGSIMFENVSFTYKNTNIEALKNVSFEIKVGESMAIIGTTGSGKSSIANLITRSFLPTSGNIFISGEDIINIDEIHLRENIGYVPQDIFLFSTSLKDNIAFGINHDLNENDIIEAAKLADLHNNIEEMPNKYDTVIGERGITLSGGQKQRASIARALIRKPTILLLDDCLSAVDTSTESRILNNLQSVAKESTIIIISHRVSSAKLADKVIVLDNGSIVEMGTNESLMNKNGIFRALYDKQLSKKKEKIE